MLKRKNNEANYLFNALNVVCSEFFQWTLKFFVISISWSMNNFLLSSSCTLGKINKRTHFIFCSSNQRTLPPILIASARSASSFNFFWLTWNGVVSVFCSEDMVNTLIFSLKKREREREIEKEWTSSRIIRDYEIIHNYIAKRENQLDKTLLSLENKWRIYKKKVILI